MYKIKNKIRKIQILSLVAENNLLQENIYIYFFLPFKLYRYVRALHGTATQIRLIKTTTINYSVLRFDGLVSSKNVPLRPGEYIIIYFG